jgi:cytochrome P450 family 110
VLSSTPAPPRPLPAPKGSSLLAALRATRDPESFFEGVSGEGDLFCVALPGVGPLYLTGHPDGARELFRAPPSTFEPVTPNPVEPLLGPGSLILLSGARHKRERKLLAPPFHGARMKAYGARMAALAQAAIDELQPGAQVDARDLTRSLTLLVIIQAIFGITESEQVDRVRDAIEETSRRYTGLLSILPITRVSCLGLSPWDRFRQAADALDLVLLDQIRRRRQAGTGEDILSVLLSLRYEDGGSMSDEDLLDELRTMLVAGHETAATALAWALGYVHADRRVRLRLLDALADSPDLAGCAYLDAVCSESMRRHPVVPIVLRRTTVPFQFRGADIPQGANVGIALTLLHTRPDVWSHPHAFHPEHFLERTYSPFQYAPFGGGARRCAGAAFARFEMRTLLGTLLRRGRFVGLGPLPRPTTQSITMSPAGPIMLRFVGRR